MALSVRILSSTNTGVGAVFDGNTATTVNAPDIIPLGKAGTAADGEVYVKVGLVASGTSGITVDTQPYQYNAATVAAPANVTGTASTLGVLAANEYLVVTNASSGVPVKVKYGTAANTNSYSYIVPGGSTANDGRGGTLEIGNFIGTITAITDGSTAAVAVTKLSST